jgi:hypothetical protein
VATSESEQVRQALERIKCAHCAHETRQGALMGQKWSPVGALKVVSYLAAALVSGFAWYGIIVAGKALLRACGVHLQ